MRIYCGSVDYLKFFERIIKDLNLKIDYRAILTDGEWEIEIKEGGKD